MTNQFSNEFKLAVIEALEIKESEYNENLALGMVKSWDSLGHLKLIFALENSLNVKFDTDEIPQLNTLKLIWNEAKKTGSLT